MITRVGMWLRKGGWVREYYVGFLVCLWPAICLLIFLLAKARDGNRDILDSFGLEGCENELGNTGVLCQWR